MSFATILLPSILVVLIFENLIKALSSHYGKTNLILRLISEDPHTSLEVLDILIHRGSSVSMYVIITPKPINQAQSFPIVY